jgi:hypothetical protein
MKASEGDLNNEWLRSLWGVTKEQYIQAMEKVRTDPSFAEWGPNPRKFKDLLKPTGQGEIGAGAYGRPPVKALPRPKTDPKVMEDGFAALNKILKGG